MTDYYKQIREVAKLYLFYFL